ncbi:creatininase family protein [Pseudoroseomonas cervicalis]|uniref:creatininase family protein n=1 Tax=Teichococcus cervicalis TaxID=204525 RepID=UPI0022F16356|nr:creatininase family protein [Pseudoroseomonas cervicalis]WBV43621.1 creatininase family protein [Pseudoroseomonas cervicalis]
MQDTTREHRWERLTAPELRALAARDALVLLPVASLEQHGPHLPVWTDSLIGHAACLRAAALASDLPVVVLPPMWLGLSEHHLPFGGTISLDYDAMHRVLRGVCRSLKAQGFGRLFLVNSHGGNIDPLAVAARELCAEFAMPVVAGTVFRLDMPGIAALLDTQPGVQHACEAETSLVMHLAPELVRHEQIAHSLSGPALPTPEGLHRFWSFAERAPGTGVIGDPRAASPEKGEKLLEVMAASLVAAMRDTAAWRRPHAVWQGGTAEPWAPPG